MECKGELDQQKLQLCRDLLEEEKHLLLGAVAPPQRGAEERGSVASDQEDQASRELQAVKRYGGFMKRYGGFMSRRTATTSAQPEDPEEHLGAEILKYLNAAAAAKDEQEEDKGGQGVEKVKRYGGFMRRADQAVQKGEVLDAEVIGRDVIKRYGGFMRRVGRPEWLLDNSKSVKRAWEGQSELHKRYGGFMD